MDFINKRLYFALRRCFDQRRRVAIKRWIALSRKKFPAGYLALYGRFTATELIAQLRDMIQEDFEILMVHSAYERLLPMYSGTVQELVNNLMAFCGPNRTLAMPAFVLGAPEYDPIKYYRRIGAFDVKRSISEMGLPTEVFRRKPRVKRSLHPTHSICAFGPLAEELTATHHLATTQKGKNSPFEVMANKRTVIVGIGVEYFRSLTQAKSVEDILEDAFPIASVKESVDVRMFDEHGVESVYPLTVRKFVQPTHGNVLGLLSPLVTQRTFHGVRLWKTSARQVTECLLEAAAKGITFYGKVPAKGRRPPMSEGEAHSVSPGIDSR
jgi:aminoglycoside N3'-acetyltransferase